VTRSGDRAIAIGLCKQFASINVKNANQLLFVTPHPNINGVFPVSTVYEMIDGRKPISAHGTRDMPIWGFRYIPSVNEWFAQPSDFNFNLASSTEMLVRTRILAIVDYLNRIQEK